MTSPNVQIQHIDKTHYTIKQSDEIAAFVGIFEKGPIDTPVYITNPDTFKFTFGRGIDDFRSDWFQVYNYLQYSSGIWVVRSGGTED